MNRAIVILSVLAITATNYGTYRLMEQRFVDRIGVTTTKFDQVKDDCMKYTKDECILQFVAKNKPTPEEENNSDRTTVDSMPYYQPWFEGVDGNLPRTISL